MKHIIYILMAIASAAQAQPAELKAKWDKCPEGWYNGPQDGQNRFMKDPYTWFVSKEFAKRFCMPESTIAPDLKGALAVAVRIKADEEVNCGFIGGNASSCPVKQKLILELYVDKAVNIPKADPTVEFYLRPSYVYESGRVIELKKRSTDIDKIRTNVKQFPPGQRGAFQPVANLTKRRETGIEFLYVGVRNGWASSNTSFTEFLYRADWADGIDQIGLYEGPFMGFGRTEDPDQKGGVHPNDPDRDNPIQKFAIAVIQGKHSPGTRSEHKKLRYPEGYAHTIEFPLKLAQFIYAYDTKSGDAFNQSVRNTVNAPAISLQTVPNK